MKLPITELLDDCRPGITDLGVPDKSMNDRVKAAVMGEIARRSRRKVVRLQRTVRLIALIAALLVMFSAIAQASGLFDMELGQLQRDHSDSGWIFKDGEGNLISYNQLDFTESGITFTFKSAATPYRVEFRPGWLPNDPKKSPGYPSEDGWYTYLIDDREQETDWYPEEGVFDCAIPYKIEVSYATADHALALLGKCKLVKQDSWDGLQVFELTCAKEIVEGNGKHLISYENYVFLFSWDAGYFIEIGGTADLETLEHIARELELRVTDEPVEIDPDFLVSILNVARG